MGRPFGKADKLEDRRVLAVRMVEKEELPQTEVARRLKVDVRTVRKWMHWHRGRGQRALQARPTPGRPARLDKKQFRRLETVLLRGAQKAGFSTDLWTCPRIAQVIQKEFGIRYHVDHVLRIMRGLGWSPQKPECRAIERDEKAILRWVKQTWPRIKKKRGV